MNESVPLAPVEPCPNNTSCKLFTCCHFRLTFAVVAISVWKVNLLLISVADKFFISAFHNCLGLAFTSIISPVIEFLINSPAIWCASICRTPTPRVSTLSVILSILNN